MVKLEKNNFLQRCTKNADIVVYPYVDGLAEKCSNSSALAMELLRSYTKPSIYT